MNLEKIRKDFPILERKIHGKPLVYFDNSATSQKPIQVIEAIVDFYKNHNANIHRGVHTLSEEASEMYEKAHENVAKFINARDAKEIIFVRNTTEATNILTHSWALKNLKGGDEIITTTMEHHSNLVPWQFLQNRGVKLRIVELNPNGTLKMEHFEKLITNKTKVITVTEVSNVLGTINPMREIGKIAHDHNTLLIVDGAQSVPHMPVDVKDINCDFLCFSGHKMLGPTGIGVLYGKEHLLERMDPFLYGGDMIREVWIDKATWNDLPWKFEAGTPNIAGGVGLSVAVDYLRKIGMKNVREHEKELTKHVIERMKDVKNLEIYGPLDPEIRGGVISFNIKGIHAHDVALILDDFGIIVRSGHHCAQPLMRFLNLNATARASFYIYNTKEEIDKFVDALKKVEKIM